MNILGLNAYAHDAGIALVRDGCPILVLEEERFDRIKKSTQFPERSIEYLRTRLGIGFDDIETVAFPWRRGRMVMTVLGLALGQFPPALHLLRPAANPAMNTRSIAGFYRLEPAIARAFHSRERPRMRFVSHHLAHAASAFFLSPFERAAVLTMDGFGDDCSTSCYEAKGSTIARIRHNRFMDSLGAVYTALTAYLGFEPMLDEGKVMALASTGTPELCEAFADLVSRLPDGGYRVNKRYFRYHRRGLTRPVSEDFIRRFGPPRRHGDPLSQRHRDVAFALQRLLEDTVVYVARWLRTATRSPFLCFGGGTALNCLLNTRLLTEAGFDGVFVPPNPSDSGAALGAALAVACPSPEQRPQFFSPYLGPEFGEAAITRELEQAGLPHTVHTDVPELVASYLATGRLVGWFQGRGEIGPRALGNRSILGDPRDPWLRDRLNTEIKRRESFRPFAPSVLAEHASLYFSPAVESPYMSFAAHVRPQHEERIPAVLADDGTARLQTVRREQNPLFHAAIQAFAQRTGVPLVLNTSFNVREPMVCTPADAIRTFRESGLDLLVIGNSYVERGPAADIPRLRALNRLTASPTKRRAPT